MSRKQIYFETKDYLIPVNYISDFKDLYKEFRSYYDNHWNSQIDELVKKLKSRNIDRRMLVSSYNPLKPDEVKICLMQFYVGGDTLSLKAYLRNSPDNDNIEGEIAVLFLTLYIVSKLTNFTPKTLILTFGTNENLSGKRIFAQLQTIKSIETICQTTDDSFQLAASEDIILCQYNDYNKLSHEEYQYLYLVGDILKNGYQRSDRTGVGIKSLFGPEMTFNLSDNTLPLLTTKRVFYRGIIEELLWFIRGSTDAKELSAKNVHIWDDNGSKEFLTKVGLGHREEGDLGPVYGFQWRHFGAKYIDKDADYAGEGVDQLGRLIDQLKRGVDNGDNLILAWNYKDLDEMALPPCHCLVQFMLEEGGKKLSCKLYQRSADMGLGVPFNIASYALLTHMISHLIGTQAGHFYHTFGDAHVYLNHVDLLQNIQLTREPRPFPKLTFKRSAQEIGDIANFSYEDFDISQYDPHPKIQMPFAV